jgi:hypothetical protein
VIETRKQKFLIEADKAEELAAKAAMPALRNGWLRIADGYRTLALDSDTSSNSASLSSEEKTATGFPN